MAEQYLVLNVQYKSGSTSPAITLTWKYACPVSLEGVGVWRRGSGYFKRKQLVSSVSNWISLRLTFSLPS